MELLDLCKGPKGKGFEKKAFLEEAAQIQECNVPSLYTITYCADGRVLPSTGRNAHPQAVCEGFGCVVLSGKI